MIEQEYNNIYLEYYNKYNFLDDYMFGNCYGYIISDDWFNTIVKFERDLIKKYGNEIHVLAFYKSCGYDGSLDYMLLNTKFEAYLQFPKAYLDIPKSLQGVKNKIKRFTPTIHKEVDLVKWLHEYKPTVNECNPIHEDGKIFLNIKNSYIGQNTLFLLKTTFTFYDYVKDCKRDIDIDFENLEQYTTN